MRRLPPFRRLRHELWNSLRASLVVGGLLAGAFWLIVPTIPPRSLTCNSMWTMKRRMLRYAHAHGALPTSIDQLPYMNGYNNEVTDAWGRPILWQTEGDVVALTSCGRDGKPGGDGNNADMIGVFRAKTNDGAWAEEICEWNADPFERDRQRR